MEELDSYFHERTYEPTPIFIILYIYHVVYFPGHVDHPLSSMSTKFFLASHILDNKFTT